MNRIMSHARTALLLAPLAALHAAELRVVNGDFSDLTGLTSGDAHGWHGGVPAGWVISAKETRYAVNSRTAPTPPVCNVSELGFLDQRVGTLAQAADVVLTLDVSEEWQAESGLGAALLDGSRGTLVKSSFHAGRGQTLVATNIPAGTTIYIRFWALWKTTPGLDNVSVATHPPGSQAASDQPTVPAEQLRGIMGDLDADFRNPPNHYRVIQYSGHDGAVMPIAKMCEYGIGGVMLFHSTGNYLRNEDSWANLKTNIRLAKEAGMQVWVADDNGYPSGQAGGLVVAADPAFELRCLSPLVQRGQGPGKARIDLLATDESFVSATIYPEKNGEPVYAAGIPVRLSGDHVETSGLDGPWVLHAFVVRINNDAGSPARGTMAGFGTSGRYPNLLNKAAMDKFLDLTHAEYARRLGPLKGQIDLFYTNEPHVGSIWHTAGQRPDGAAYLPWDAALPERFRKDHGYDLMPFLPALYAGTSDQDKLARRHYFQTVGNLFEENFTGRLARWCGENGVKSGGHLFGEERMDLHAICYGNFFQALQKQQAPGCDIPMPSLGEHWNYWMPKLASSAAQLHDRETVTCLLDPIIDRKGDLSFLTAKPQTLMRFINMAFFCGVNQMSNYQYWGRYTSGAYRKFNEQVGRLAVMLRGARNASTVALYYPIESSQCTFRPIAGNLNPMTIKSKPANYNPQALLMEETEENVIRSLHRHGCDFSWLDGDAVLGAEIRAGRLMIGAHEYTSIIMPRVELLPLPVIQKLQRFEKAGGKVLWVDSLPRLGDKPEEHAPLRAAMAASQTIPPDKVVGKLGPAFPESFLLRVDSGGEGLFIARYVRNTHRVNYLVNNSDKPMAPKLSLAGKDKGTVWIYEPAGGTINALDVPTSLAMPPYTSVFVVELTAAR